MTLSNWDADKQIGWKLFHLQGTHPFYRAAMQHDAAYDLIRNGTSYKTLKEYDEEFLHNMRRVAKAFLLRGRFLYYWQLQREARIFYNIVRAWGQHVRPELDAWKPGDGPL